MPPECLCGPTVYNQFTFVPNYSKVVNVVKLPQVVYKIACYQFFSTPSHMDARRDHRGSTGLAEYFPKKTYLPIWPPMTYDAVKCHIAVV